MGGMGLPPRNVKQDRKQDISCYDGLFRKMSHVECLMTSAFFQTQPLLTLLGERFRAWLMLSPGHYWALY